MILASASPRRKMLLAGIGLPPVVVPSRADETIPAEMTDPARIVEMLSARKAASLTREEIAAALRDAAEGPEPAGQAFPKPVLVLGADTVVALEGRILGKPADREEAHRMLSLLSGKWHAVYTGVTLLLYDPDGTLLQEETFREETRVRVMELRDAEINEYIASGEPFDKAGGYGIQGPFGRYTDRIEGEYANVVGLPAAAVYRTVRDVFKLL